MVNLAYTTILPTMHTPSAITVSMWGLASLLIEPQSILLGMTFPLMSGDLSAAFPIAPALP